jgi:hypothetical protein
MVRGEDPMANLVQMNLTDHNWIKSNRNNSHFDSSLRSIDPHKMPAIPIQGRIRNQRGHFQTIDSLNPSPSTFRNNSLTPDTSHQARKSPAVSKAQRVEQRLSLIEKIAKYREEKIRREFVKLEQEVREEEARQQKQREKEEKMQEYHRKQKEKLQEYLMHRTHHLSLFR